MKDMFNLRPLRGAAFFVAAYVLTLQSADSDEVGSAIQLDACHCSERKPPRFRPDGDLHSDSKPARASRCWLGVYGAVW